jgi:hypothetical protein
VKKRAFNPIDMGPVERGQIKLTHCIKCRKKVEKDHFKIDNDGWAVCDDKARHVLLRLLNCCELNLDEMEPATRQIIVRAQKVLGIYEKNA